MPSKSEESDLPQPNAEAGDAELKNEELESEQLPQHNEQPGDRVLANDVDTGDNGGDSDDASDFSESDSKENN